MNKISVLCALHTFENKAFSTWAALSKPGMLRKRWLANSLSSI